MVAVMYAGHMYVHNILYTFYNNMYTCCYNKVDLPTNLVNTKSLIMVYSLFESLTANVRIRTYISCT